MTQKERKEFKKYIPVIEFDGGHEKGKGFMTNHPSESISCRGPQDLDSSTVRFVVFVLSLRPPSEGSPDLVWMHMELLHSPCMFMLLNIC